MEVALKPRPFSRDRPLALIADDESDILELLAVQIARAGYSPLRAATGEAALRLALKHEPALALIDIKLPLLDGWEVARRMRAAGLSTWLILVSASVLDSDAAIGIDAGADGYLRKPFSAHELRVRLAMARTRAAAAV